MGEVGKNEGKLQFYVGLYVSIIGVILKIFVMLTKFLNVTVLEKTIENFFEIIEKNFKIEKKLKHHKKYFKLR